MDEPVMTKVMDENKLRELTRILQGYKAGKARLERRVVSAENWWRLRNETEEKKHSELGDGGFRSKSGWLHNVIVSKHADAMDAYPEPNILPREPGDEEEARKLSAIVPVVLEQNRFEEVYSAALWSKLKTGTGVYKVVWDTSKLGGLGEISVMEVDLLNLFWEPGVEDIQESKYFFHTRLFDSELLEQQYPQLRGRLRGSTFRATRFLCDDAAPTEGKSTVIDCYYKKWEGGRRVLHYVRYVDECVLYSSEDEGRPLYEHGLYPFVFDALFPVEGSPCGYGFVDLCENPQTAIDLMDTAFIRNTMVGAMPRYFRRQDASINETELLDLNRPLVTVDGNLGDDALKIIDFRPLSGNYIDYQRERIRELRETSGNTETSTGTVSQGVTAASAIAALQEASAKGSRDSTRTSYRAYAEVVGLVIELIRQFYDLPRQFRITGELGQRDYLSFSNERIRPQPQGTLAGVEMGMRLPVFDIEVRPQKAGTYTKMSQNELALQFYNLGFFDPQRSEQALLCLDMMEFDGRDRLRQKLRRTADTYGKMILFQQLALTLAMKHEPELAAALTGGVTGRSLPPRTAAAPPLRTSVPGTARTETARARTREAPQPGGGA
ncbi:MAG: hypothetical protein IJP64_06320 [Oscillospiraceae bacterium]|nr:hypothetical protein [Oscillospiraceae bacterium]